MQQDSRFQPPDRARDTPEWADDAPGADQVVPVVPAVAIAVVLWIVGLWLLYQGAHAAGWYAVTVLYERTATWVVTGSDFAAVHPFRVVLDLGVDVLRMAVGVAILWFGARLYRGAVPLRNSAMDP